jgi:parallel beta-helix repeat protein
MHVKLFVVPLVRDRKATLILLLILSFVLASIPQIAVANTEGTIYTRPDGSIEGTNKILRNGNLYNFTSDINSDTYDSYGIVIEKNDIILDGMGYTFQGNGSGTGIDISNRTRVTVQNLRIKNFQTGITYFHRGGSPITSENKLLGNKIYNCTIGIHILAEHQITLRDNEMFDNQQNFFLRGVYRFDFNHNVDSSNTVDGKPIYYWINRQNMKVPNDAGTVILVDCKNIIVQNLNLSHNRVGVYLVSTSYSTITNNFLQNNEYGLFFWDSDNNVVNENTVLENDYGLALNGESNKNKFQNNSFNDNKINLCPRYSSANSNYLVSNLIDESNTVNNKPVYYWTYHYNEEVPSDAGYIALINCDRITVKNQNISNNQDGILLVGTTQTTITNSTFSNNFEGITCFSSENTIVGNEITNNTSSGISIYGGLNNNITGNYIAANEKGANLKESSDNVLSRNNFRNNRYGICLYNAPNNTIVENQIQENNVGLAFNAIAYQSTSGNLIINNNLVNNARQVTYSLLFAPTIINIWDNGSEGNYWSNYNGTDYNIDGIGDTPYVIDADNQDNYPLMEPTFIPEFPSWAILGFILAGSLTIVLFKKKVWRQF